MSFEAWVRVGVVALGVASVSGCSRATTPSGSGVVRSEGTESRGLTITFELSPEGRVDRVPLRIIKLHFRNTSSEPLRIFMPRSEPFRSSQSWLLISAGDQRFTVPEPRPHGYAISEVDFPLLAPGEERVFEQSFTLDPMKPGPGTDTARRPGFEDGAVATIVWTYENQLVRWPVGARTLDGPTASLFGGGDIPHIWTGKVSATARWTVGPSSQVNAP